MWGPERGGPHEWPSEAVFPLRITYRFPDFGRHAFSGFAGPRGAKPATYRALPAQGAPNLQNTGFCQPQGPKSLQDTGLCRPQMPQTLQNTGSSGLCRPQWPLNPTRYRVLPAPKAASTAKYKVFCPRWPQSVKHTGQTFQLQSKPQINCPCACAFDA